MDDSGRLYELLIALFRDDAELRRFLVVQEVPPDVSGPATKGSSLRVTAAEVARSLIERGLADDAFFAALERRSPGRADDIRAVADAYRSSGVPPPPPPAPPPPPPPPVPPMRAGEPALPTTREEVNPEVAEFTRRLRADLATIALPDPIADATDEQRWPWSAAASVLGQFQPLQLRPLGRAATGTSALTTLAGSVHTTFTGASVLRDDVRAACLRRLHEDGALDAALDANASLADPRRDLMRLVLDEELPRLAEMTSSALVDLDVVVGWLAPLDLPALDTVDQSSIRAAVERRDLIDPMRALVGRHFQGRRSELARIDGHLRAKRTDPLLRIQGPGGAGKSSLIGKVLLDLEDRRDDDPVAFAYLDFDRARNDPFRPPELLAQIAKQLRLLYATRDDASDFAALESYSSGDDLEDAATLLDVELGGDLDTMVSLVASRLEQVHGRYGSKDWPPLILVLDTFEEVQLKGPGAVAGVVDLVERLAAALPDMRILASGRGEVPDLIGAPSPPLRLGDLEPDAADRVLESLGVAEARLRTVIVSRFGGNPLTLRLAAEALRRAGTADQAFHGVTAEANVLAEVAREQIQGMLYGRILGHIGDPEIAAIAHPGLVVRRVTVDIVRDVLAGPCQLDPARAGEIFERLRAQMTLFEPDGPDAVRHRQDVRRLMLRAMNSDKARQPTIAEIHRLAIDFYTARADDAARIEELYHRLMSGEDPRQLSGLWDRRFTPALASALEEPLPAAARRWLERRLGLAALDESEEWDQVDWEASAASRAESWLASTDPARALEVLTERTARLPGSELYLFDVRAHLSSGDVDAASSALAAGVQSAVSVGDEQLQLRLADVAIDVGVARHDPAAIVGAGRTVASLADLTGQESVAVSGLADAVDALRAIGPPGEDHGLVDELTRRFMRLSGDDLRADRDLVRHVLRTAGASDPAIVIRAATEIADESEPATAIFSPDTFIVERLLRDTADAGLGALGGLAKELGLEDDKWDAGEVARLAIRHGRTGQAIALGVAFAPDDVAAASAVVDTLVAPATGLRSEKGWS